MSFFADMQSPPFGPLPDLQRYLDSSPSPFHAAANNAQFLGAAGFAPVDETAAWGGVRRGYVMRGGALIAWDVPDTARPGTPFRIVGAHTDSPGLRVKPKPDAGAFGWKQLLVEVYGGVLLNSWLDRDLGVAGRVTTRDGETRLVAVHEPIARVPQLAIHLDRDVNDKGLQLDRQVHLTPVWGTGSPSTGEFAEWLATMADLPADEVAWWELQLFDVTPSAVVGADRSLLASGRLDNQLSCWAATTALARLIMEADGDRDHISVIALFDHEEVGSDSTTGAAGPILETVLERIALGLSPSATRDDLHRAFARSSCISADNAHAVHPNYPERHDPGHRPLVHGGPAIKINSNQRYATHPETAALFQRCCEAAGVPWQTFVSRNNIPCGSTIGPITATRLGIATVDVGVPQLSMHSARELCGVDDPLHLRAALIEYLVG